MDRERPVWILGGLALAAATVLRALSLDDGHSTGYVIGSVLGSIVGAVLLGLLIRFVYVRLLRRGQPVWSGWVLVIAAVVSFLVAAGRVGEREQEQERAERTCATPARTAEQLVASLPGGLRGEPAPKEVVDQFAAGFPPEQTRRLTGQSVVDGSEPIGAVVVIELREPANERDLFAGFEEGAQGEVEDAPLGSATGRLHRAPDGGATLIGLSGACAATVVVAVSPEAAREIGAALPVEPA